jgi:predicted transcriptional regulator
MAQQLVERHGLKQDQVAGVLGISQSSVSKYGKKVRGYIINLDEVLAIHPLISEMVNMVLKGQYQRTEFLELFCKACLIIRQTGMICDFCKKTEARINIAECSFCLKMT